jgi:hypothetical protein
VILLLLQKKNKLLLLHSVLLTNLQIKIKETYNLFLIFEITKYYLDEEKILISKEEIWKIGTIENIRKSHLKMFIYQIFVNTETNA